MNCSANLSIFKLSRIAISNFQSLISLRNYAKKDTGSNLLSTVSLYYHLN